VHASSPDAAGHLYIFIRKLLDSIWNMLRIQVLMESLMYRINTSTGITFHRGAILLPEILWGSDKTAGMWRPCHCHNRGKAEAKDKLRDINIITFVIPLLIANNSCYFAFTPCKAVCGIIYNINTLPSISWRLELYWKLPKFEICDLLRCYAASNGNPLLTFRDNVSVPPSRVK
jgi:hypothetical protein